MVHLPITAVSKILGVVRMKVAGGITSAIKNRLHHRINEEVFILHDLDKQETRSDVGLVTGHNIPRRSPLSATNVTSVHLTGYLGITCR